MVEINILEASPRQVSDFYLGEGRTEKEIRGAISRMCDDLMDAARRKVCGCDFCASDGNSYLCGGGCVYVPKDEA